MYRVYAAWMKTEKTFQIKSMNSEHECAKKYKNSKVNVRLISAKLIENFRS